MKLNLLFSIPLFIFGTDGKNEAQTLKPGEIWPDNNGVHINAHGSGVVFHEGTYYWFGEHKIEGKKGNQAWVGVHCYSSQNLTDWKDEGIALPVNKDPESPIVEGCIIERPKVIYNKKNKQFVMWFHHELKGMGYDAAKTGLAVADKVTGPYQGKYYFIASGCTGWAPNEARLAVADDIYGPWTELGNPCVGEGKETTFDSQSTYILSVQGKKDAFIFMADRWNPENTIDGRYVWLPVQFDENGLPFLQWLDEWELSIFE